MTPRQIALSKLALLEYDFGEPFYDKLVLREYDSEGQSYGLDKRWDFSNPLAAIAELAPMLQVPACAVARTPEVKFHVKWKTTTELEWAIAYDIESGDVIGKPFDSVYLARMAASRFPFDAAGSLIPCEVPYRRGVELNNIWAGRGNGFLHALYIPLKYLRDTYGLLVTPQTYLSLLSAENLVTLIGPFEGRFCGLDRRLSMLRSYVESLPGYQSFRGCHQDDSVFSQHQNIVGPFAHIWTEETHA